MVASVPVILLIVFNIHMKGSTEKNTNVHSYLRVGKSEIKKEFHKLQ